MTDPITPEYLDELDALSEAATEGPWEPRARMNSCRADDAFIAEARQAVPRLVKALREAEVADLSTLLEHPRFICIGRLENGRGDWYVKHRDKSGRVRSVGQGYGAEANRESLVKFMLERVLR